MNTMTAPKKRRRRRRRKRATQGNGNKGQQRGHIESAAERVRDGYRGVRLLIGKTPQSRKVADHQKAAAIRQFEAKRDAVSMSRRLFDAKEEAVKHVNSVFAKIKAVYEDPRYTLPHPQRGVRLIKEGEWHEDDPEVQTGLQKAGDSGKHLVRLNLQLETLSEELQEAATQLAIELPAIRKRERERQGELFREADYDFDPVQVVSVSWQFVEVGVPAYLMQLDPRLVEITRKQVQEQFEEACRLKEEEMAQELYNAMAHVVGVLSGKRDDGRPKVFRNHTAEKLVNCLDAADVQLRENGIGQGALQTAFGKLREVIAGETSDTIASNLRKSEAYRDVVSQGMQEVMTYVEQNVALRPRRRLLRKSKTEQETGA